MASSIAGKRRTPAVSRTSILILAAFLLGITSYEVLALGVGGFKFYVFVSAVVGLLSFVGLDALAKKRERQLDAMASEVASKRMNERVQRHVRD